MTFSLQVVCIDCGGPVEAGKNRCAAHLRHTPDRKTSPPRALCAISEDRQWLVVRCREGTGYGLMFAVLMNRGGDYEVFEHIRDTGQSAEDVLRDYLAEREA